MITVYGADWCEDTRRSLRHLRRLAVAHQYINVDEDLDALHRATAMNGGERRTPTIDLGIGGSPLVEPDNDALTGALIEMEMLTLENAHERLGVQNVGDLERVLRTSAGVALLLAGGRLPRGARSLVRIAGSLLALTGVAGWSLAYHAAGVSSLDGPGDRPGEAHRATWLAPRSSASLPDEPQPGTEPAGSAR
ncbi:MAG: YgaP-like transmembrane domain [Acidobacteriota bacterium]